MVKRSLVVLLTALALGASESRAQDWIQVVAYDPVNGYLGDLKPEPGRYDNFEIYDERTARFYSVFDFYPSADRVFVVEVFSNDFQPALSIQDLDQNVLVRGTFSSGAATAGYSYATRLEYHADEEIAAQLLITSHDINQGYYQITWSLWRHKDAAPATPTPTPPAGNNNGPPSSECDCYDPASNRWFQEPMWGGGACIPAEAIQWCN